MLYNVFKYISVMDLIENLESAKRDEDSLSIAVVFSLENRRRGIYFLLD